MNEESSLPAIEYAFDATYSYLAAAYTPDHL